jgi:hypothetical protein
MEDPVLSRRVPRQCAATPAEVRGAVSALTPSDLLRLERFARWRVRGLGRRALGRSHEDLLGDAIHATLDGRRSWNKANVDFVGHLLGAVQSISDNWGRRFRSDEPVLEADVGRVEERPSLADVPGAAPTQEDELVAKQREEAVAKLFEDDSLVTLIVCELKEGATLRDIRAKYDIPDNEYEAAMKRLRRKLARAYEEETHA